MSTRSLQRPSSGYGQEPFLREHPLRPSTSKASPTCWAAAATRTLGRLKEVLAALEAKERLVQLLNAYIDSRQGSVRVIFDLEEQAPELAGLVLIAAPARMAGEGRGTVAVLGPKRMHYQNTLNAVSYVAEVVERMLHRAHTRSERARPMPGNEHDSVEEDS